MLLLLADGVEKAVFFGESDDFSKHIFLKGKMSLPFDFSQNVYHFAAILTLISFPAFTVYPSHCASTSLSAIVSVGFYYAYTQEVIVLTLF